MCPWENFPTQMLMRTFCSIGCCFMWLIVTSCSLFDKDGNRVDFVAPKATPLKNVHHYQGHVGPVIALPPLVRGCNVCGGKKIKLLCSHCSIYGHKSKDDAWMIAKVDFSSLLTRKCDDDKDYYTWSTLDQVGREFSLSWEQMYKEERWGCPEFMRLVTGHSLAACSAV